MAEKRWLELFIGLFLIFISTITYLGPNYIVDVDKIDQILVQPEFYSFFVWKLGGLFLLNAIYSFLLFIYIHPKFLILKIILLWMVIGETSTFIIHVIDKVFRHKIHDNTQSIIVLIVFSIFCTFFIKRAIYKQKSDVFNPNNTYIINKLPTSTLSLLNYIFHHSGHKSFYQDGNFYKFNKKYKKVIKVPATSEFLQRKDIIFKEIPSIKDPERLLGKKFKLFRYNCNHMIKDAQGTD